MCVVLLSGVQLVVPLAKSPLLTSWFPNGLCKAGSVYDEISGGKAIKRIGSVDLGSLTWVYNEHAASGPSAKSGFSTPRPADLKTVASTVIGNIVCAKYPTKTVSAIYTGADKCIGIAASFPIMIADSTAGTDPTTFKTAMSGVMLYYELATPIVVDLPSGLNLNYRMDDFGTEELINTDVASNVPGLCAPTDIRIEYQDNLRDKIRRLDDNYVSLNPQENSESEKLTARQNIGAAATSGAYPELLAGNLVGQTVDNDTYLIRPTGNGGEDVASGTASVVGMKGNSCVWNQLVQNGNFASNTGWESANQTTLSVQNNVATLTYNTTPTTSYGGALKTSTAFQFQNYIGKTILITCEVNIPHASYVIIDINNVNAAGSSTYITETNVWKRIGLLATIANTAAAKQINIYPNGLVYSNGDAYHVRNVQLFNLTLLGIDNLTTISQVKAWFAKHIGTKPYYAYNAGTILSAKTTGMKTYGQNLLNPTTREAKLIPYEWEDNSNIYTIKNVPSGATATFTPDNTGGAETVDVSGGSLDITNYGSGVLELSAATTNTYVCIKWDSTKDDDVVPYEEHTYGFDVTKVYGKVNGEGEYVQCFPNGMRSAKSVHDTLTASEAVVNVLEYTFSIPLSTQSSYVRYSKSSQMRSYIGSSYILQAPLKKIDSGVDSNPMCWSENETVINVNYNGVGSDVQNYMSGKKMYFYAKTPITYTDLIYRDNGVDTPLTDSLLQIDVDNWSMEEQTVQDNSLPCTISTIYGLNAVEAIAKLQRTTYTESEIHSNLASLISCINTNCSTVLGGTFSVSDTATEKVFSFTFTPNE